MAIRLGTETCASRKSTTPCLLAIPAFDRVAGLCKRHRNSNTGICWLTGEGVQFINQCGSEYGEVVSSCEHEQWTFSKWLINWPFMYSALHFILCTEFSQFLRRILAHWFLSYTAHTLKRPLSHVVTTNYLNSVLNHVHGKKKFMGT